MNDDELFSGLYEETINKLNGIINDLIDAEASNHIISALKGDVEEIRFEKAHFDMNLRKQEIKEQIAQEKEYFESVLGGNINDV